LSPFHSLRVGKNHYEAVPPLRRIGTFSLDVLLGGQVEYMCNASDLLDKGSPFLDLGFLKRRRVPLFSALSFGPQLLAWKDLRPQINKPRPHSWVGQCGDGRRIEPDLRFVTD
jgi:hypothetical protein